MWTYKITNPDAQALFIIQESTSPVSGFSVCADKIRSIFNLPKDTLVLGIQASTRPLRGSAKVTVETNALICKGEVRSSPMEISEWFPELAERTHFYMRPILKED